MLQDRATNEEIRRFLQREIGQAYPEGETSSMIRLILEHLGTSLQEQMLHPAFKHAPAFVAQIKEIVSEIHRGRPIQYILGYAWFGDLKIRVNDNVLIPRPETEELSQRITRESKEKPGQIMDLCSGSGCLALALKHVFPQARVYGLEISREAIRSSGETSRELGLEVTWMEGDILRGADAPGEGPYDLVVSNPPYVREKEKALMEAHVLDFEPHQALFVDDRDPLIFYRAIASYARDRLSPGGSLWLEINEALGAETSALLQRAGFTRIELMKDIHEKDRFIRAQR